MLKILDNNYKCVGILNFEGNLEKVTPYFDDKYYQNLTTGAETFEFSTIGDCKQAENLVVGNHIVFKDYDGITRLFSIINVEDSHEEDFIKTVYCEICGLELINDIVRPMTVNGKNCYLFLQSVLQDTDWQVGYVDSALSQPKDFEITDYKTVYSVLQEYVAGTYEGEISFRAEFANNRLIGKYVDVYSQRNANLECLFSYSKNMSSVTRKIDSSNLVTALIGVGNNNITFKSIQAEDKPLDQDFIASESALKKWGKNGQHLMGVFKADTDDSATLLELTRKELEENTEPHITYEIKAELLDKVPHIGATVGIADHDLKLYLTARISELTTSKTNPDSNECVFCNFKEIQSSIKDITYKGILSELKSYLENLTTGVLTETTLENIKRYLNELNLTKEEIDAIFKDLNVTNTEDDNKQEENEDDNNNNNNENTEIVLKQFVVIGSTTNIRDGVGTDANVIGQGKVDDRFELIERNLHLDTSQYEWAKIKYEDASEGYAYCALVEGNYITNAQTTSETSTTTQDGLWIGDSITVDMKDTYKLIDSSIGVYAKVGKWAYHYLKDFNSLVSTKSNPKYISILLGVNNPTDVTNQKTLLNKLLSAFPSVPIFVHAVLPVGEKYTCEDFESSYAYNKAIANYNNKMKEYCDSTKNLYYVNTSTNQLTSNGYLKESMSAGDYIHLNKNGATILYNNLKTGIISALENIGGIKEWWKEGKMSATCFRFLKGMEGFGKYAYQDSAGYWTIAYGVTQIGEEDVFNSLKSQQPLSEEIGAKASYDVLNANYGAKIFSAVKALGCTNQNQFDALCSVAYNCGIGAVTGTNTLTTAIKKNPNDEEYIRPIWEKFKVTAGGVKLAGLVTRRKNECNMFFGKSVEVRSIGTINANGSYGATIKDNNGNGWLPEETGGTNGADDKGYNDILTTLQGEKQKFTLKDGYAYNCKVLTSLQFTLPTSPTSNYSSKLVFRTPKDTSPMFFKQSKLVWLTGDDCINGALLPIADSKYEIVIKYNTNSTIPRLYRGNVTRVSYGGSYKKHSGFTGASTVIELAKSYYDNRGLFKYNTTTPISYFASGTPASNIDKWKTDGLFHIDCSTFTNFLFKARGFNNSIYANLSYGTGKSTKYSFGLDLGRYASAQAETCVSNGWHLPDIKTKEDWHKLKAGDLIFWSSRSTEGSRNEVVASRYMQVGHVGVVAELVTDEETGEIDVLVYDVSNLEGTVLYRSLTKDHPDKILFFARIRK